MSVVTVPLAELHVHLEGTVRRETAISLSSRHGLAPPPPYDYATLGEFLAIYGQVCTSMASSEDFERVIHEHARVMKQQNITYAEISFNPSLHPGEDWLDGIARGKRRVERELGISIAWLVEMVRGAPFEDNERSLEIAIATEGVVGIGLVGDESIGAAPLAPLIERANAAGLGFMPHAGQAGGPEVVREAVAVLGATRVAHGVSAAGDQELMRLLVERNVCLCICPSSNARVNLKPDYKKLAAAGIPLTVNTDDPAMVPTTLNRELEVAETQHGLSREALIAASWQHRFMGPQ
ncbi:MAG TPA: adenosine deaminase family protein [Candidatus Dormibacteraeota bacterium]